MGHKGWVGVYLDGAGIDWALLGELIDESYRLIAPKRLAALAAGGTSAKKTAVSGRRRPRRGKAKSR